MSCGQTIQLSVTTVNKYEMSKISKLAAKAAEIFEEAYSDNK